PKSHRDRCSSEMAKEFVFEYLQQNLQTNHFPYEQKYECILKLHKPISADLDLASGLRPKADCVDLGAVSDLAEFLESDLKCIPAFLPEAPMHDDENTRAFPFPLDFLYQSHSLSKRLLLL